jgi:hypothetical protein
MSDWVRRAAEFERKRQERVREFIAAAKTFFSEFARQVEEHLKAYREEFPGEQVELRAT